MRIISDWTWTWSSCLFSYKLRIFQAVIHLSWCYSQDSKKSRRKYRVTSRKSVTSLMRCHLCPSQDGMATTWLNHLQTCHGTRDGPRRSRRSRPLERHCSKLLMPSSHHKDPVTSHSVYHSRMCTKLEVLEQCQLVESRPVSSNQEWLSHLLQATLPLRLVTSTSFFTTISCNM